MIAAAASQAPVKTIFRSNVERIRREFPPAVYQHLQEEIRSGKRIVVELV